MQYKDEKDRLSDVKKITLGEAIDEYVEAKSNVLSKKTYYNYKGYRKWYMQDIIDTPIDKLNTQILQRSVNLEAAKHSPKTVSLSFGLVRVVLGYFMPDRAYRVKMPQKRPTTYNTPDGEVLKKIFTAAEGTEIEVPILLAAWLSLRLSEISGLKWTDISEDSINVNEASIYQSSAL